MEPLPLTELTYECFETNLQPYYLSALVFHFVGASVALTGLLVAGLPSFNRR